MTVRDSDSECESRVNRTQRLLLCSEGELAERVGFWARRLFNFFLVWPIGMNRFVDAGRSTPRTQVSMTGNKVA